MPICQEVILVIGVKHKLSKFYFIPKKFRNNNLKEIFFCYDYYYYL